MKPTPTPTKHGKPGTPLRAHARPLRGPDRKEGWQKRFFEALRICPDVTAACAFAGVGTSTVYRRRDDTPSFKEGWEDALRDGLEAARGELYRRGVLGWEEPVYQGGKLVGTKIVRSDACLMFFLKTHRPEVYGDKSKIEHTALNPNRMTPEEEFQAGEEALQSITHTIRQDIMRGLRIEAAASARAA